MNKGILVLGGWVLLVMGMICTLIGSPNHAPYNATAMLCFVLALATKED